jgi:hypothetical protein
MTISGVAKRRFFFQFSNKVKPLNKYRIIYKIDAQRALLISTERRRALLIERDRILNGLPPSNSTEPKGTLSFSSISLQLHKDYVNSYLQHKDSKLAQQTTFCCLIYQTYFLSHKYLPFHCAHQMRRQGLPHIAGVQCGWHQKWFH